MTGEALPILVQEAPFAGAQLAGSVPEGASVMEIAARFVADQAAWPWLRAWLRSADGREAEVPRGAWARVRPRAGVTVLLRVVPAGGGGGKNILRIVLAIAVVAAAAVVGPVIGGAISAATGMGVATANALGSLAVTLAGTLALNALIPPPRPNLGAASRLAMPLTGVANQALPFGTVPRIYGRVRVFPPLAARVISEGEGEAQFLRALFDFGYGPLSISELRIGTTPIGQFQGVETEFRAGWPDDPPITLYPETVREDGYAIRLRGGEGQTVETRDAAREAIVDVTFLGLVAFGDKGERNTRTVRLRYEWRPAAGGTWTLHAERDVSAASEQRTTRGERIVFPAAGRYAVRVTRLTADSSSPQIRDECYLTALRSVQGGAPVRAKGRALLAMRIRATDQLSGTLDQVNAVAQAILPVWNGSAWAWQETRNPAWAYVDVLRGAANPRPVADSRLDLPAFLAWAEDCAAAPPSGSGPRREFNGVFDSRTTVFEALRDIAAAGRAAFGMREGKFSIVRDVPQTVPIQHFTPRNSRDFVGRRAFGTPPHAVRARYIEPAREWSQQEVIVYADGHDETTATRIEEIEWFGVTSRDQAWRETRYAMAVARLRPETYELTTDIEHLMVARGDLVRVTHDVPAFGVSAARVASATDGGAGAVTSVVLDEAVAVEAGRSYAIRLRAADGTSHLSPVEAPPGERTTFTLLSPIAGDRSAADAANLCPNPTAAGAAPGAPGTLPTGWAATSNGNGVARSIVGTGVEDGIPYVDIRWQGTASAAANLDVAPAAVSSAAGRRYAFGAFLRLVAGSTAGLSGMVILLQQRQGNTSLGTAGATQPFTPTEAPLRTQQAQANRQVTNASTDNVRPMIRLSVPAGATVDITLRYGYPQIEEAASSTQPVTPFAPRIARGDLALVGEAGRESVELIVKEIRPGPDLSATLVLVDAAPAVHQAETAPIPPYDPQITAPPAPGPRQAPPPPAILDVYSDERALLRAADGTLQARLAVVAAAPEAATAQLRWRRAGSGEPWALAAAVAGTSPFLLFSAPVEEGASYEAAVRAISSAGAASAWVAAAPHVVVGKTSPPPDVAEFRISGRRLDWAPVEAPDLAGYLIRWAPGAVSDWGSMLPAHAGVLTASPFTLDEIPTGPVSIAIKAVDTGGRHSAQAAFIFTDLGEPPLRFGAAMRDLRALGWRGERHGAVVVDGDLCAPDDGALPMWGASDAAMLWTADAAPMWPATLWPALAYEEDLGFDAPPAGARVLADLRADGAGARLRWKQVPAFWGAEAAAMWSGDAAPMWPADPDAPWRDLIAPIPGTLLPVRLRADVAAGTVRPRLTKLVAWLDAERIEETFADVPLAPGGSRLPIARSYAAIATVVATLQAGTAARTLRVVDKDPLLGPLLQALDAAGDGVAATVDATVTGY